MIGVFKEKLRTFNDLFHAFCTFLVLSSLMSQKVYYTQMKKIDLLAMFLLLLVSCQKDDETFVPINDAPQNVVVQSLTNTSVTLQWDHVNADRYTIEYGVSGFQWGQGTIATTTTTSIFLNNLLADTTYDFRIEAIFSDNSSTFSTINSFTTLMSPVSTVFMPLLSQMRIFQGTLENLTVSPYAFEYDLNTRLFTDYSHKKRIIALPAGTSMSKNGDGLPTFPDNTLIAKTFYYNLNEMDLSLGKKIIETRILLKVNGNWEFGDYIWNESQNEAFLDNEGSVVPVEWIDEDGATKNINYKVPSTEDCIACHSSSGNKTPIGPKLRTLNFEVNGVNQLQRLKDMQFLIGLSSPNDVSVLPNWEDPTATLEERARAYFDIQCAHCHSSGGFCETQSTLRLSYETSLADSKIAERKSSISSRINTYVPGFSMPYKGTTIIHTEGVALIQEYLDTL